MNTNFIEVMFDGITYRHIKDGFEAYWVSRGYNRLPGQLTKLNSNCRVNTQMNSLLNRKAFDLGYSSEDLAPEKKRRKSNGSGVSSNGMKIKLNIKINSSKKRSV